MTSASARRRALLASALVVVVCLGVVAFVVLARGSGDSLGDKIQSLKDDSVPASRVVKDREELLKVSRDFATQFNTYDPSMLDDEGHLPAYQAVADLMSAKFADVFKRYSELPEKTVAEAGVSSIGTVYAVGVASQDSDSAEVLVAGTIELLYPYDDTDGSGAGDDGAGDDGVSSEDDEPGNVSTGPQRFRYNVSLVKIDGTWLVDDVDDIDDGQPSFGSAQIPEGQPTDGAPSTSPETDAPSQAPSTESTEGEQ